MTAFDFAEYLDLAEVLATGSDEAAWRSAVSRAYYAVLHVAFQALPNPVRATISHRSTHRATWQFYTASSVPVCRQVGHAGIRLLDRRVEADYVASLPMTSARAVSLVANAREVMERLRRHGYQP